MNAAGKQWLSGGTTCFFVVGSSPNTLLEVKNHLCFAFGERDHIDINFRM